MPAQATDGLRELRRADPGVCRLQKGRTVSNRGQPIQRPLFRVSHTAHVVGPQADTNRIFVAGTEGAGSDVDDGARPRTVPNRKSPAVDVYSIDGGGIKGADQTL